MKKIKVVFVLFSSLGYWTQDLTFAKFKVLMEMQDLIFKKWEKI
jgi:hypothetical protein